MPGTGQRHRNPCRLEKPDEQWTLLEPNIRYAFQIATKVHQNPIKAERASAKIRLLVRQDGESRFQDASFANNFLR